MSLLFALPLANLGLATLAEAAISQPAPSISTPANAPVAAAIDPAPAQDTPASASSAPEQPDIGDPEPDTSPKADTTGPADTAETPPPYTEAEKAELAADPLAGDPLEAFNRASYAITEPIDALVLRPVAIIYKTLLPVPARDGVRNALANLFSPTVLANDLLQLRPSRAVHTVLRFAINSTLGLGGLFDMAKRKPFNLAPHSNGFGATLGYYGSPPGPYLYLPVLGPTTVRELFGALGDAFTEPLLLDHFTRQSTAVVGTGTRKRTISIFSSGIQVSTYGLATMVVGGVDSRAENDESLQVIKNQSVDPYAALRSSYLQDRAGEIAALKAKDDEVAQIPAFDAPLSDPGKP